jgi:biotin operon repressor
MSVPAVGWARRTGVELRLPTFARILLLTLADILGQSGKLYPSIPYLAEQTGLSENSVRKWLRYLQGRGVIEILASIGNRTHYRLLRDRPLQDLKGSDQPPPARRGGSTPARREGVQDVDPCKSERGPLQIGPPTPARLAPEPLEPRINQDARERAREGSFKNEWEEERDVAATPQPDDDPLDRPVDPEMVRSEVAKLFRELRMKAYPPRAAVLDPQEQQDLLSPRKIRPAFLTGAALAASRAACGIPVPVGG